MTGPTLWRLYSVVVCEMLYESILTDLNLNPGSTCLLLYDFGQVTLLLLTLPSSSVKLNSIYFIDDD